MNERTTRRRFIKIGALTSVAGALSGIAGCSELPFGNGENGDSSAMSVVPEGVTSVAYADVAGMLEDEAIERLLNEFLELANEESAYDAPTTKEELIEDIREETDLDPTGLVESLVFGKAPDLSTTPESAMQYGGAWFTADWSESALVEELESSGSELIESEYAGHTIYESASEFSESSLGVLSGGEYILATGNATKDVIDVWEGNMNSVGSELTNPYSSVRSGLFKAASTIPEDRIPDESIGGNGVELRPELIAKVQNAAISGYRDNDRMGMESLIETDSSDAADDLASILDGAVAVMENAVASEELSSTLDSVTVEQIESSVSIGYESDVDTISNLIGELVSEFKRVGDPGVVASRSTSIEHHPAFVSMMSL